MIDIRGLSFSYGRAPVLCGITFSAGDGEVVSVLGSNGAGKSTLITCINRIRRPSAGDVMIDGESTMRMNRRSLARRIAYVPQQALPSGMSVFDSILLGRRPYMGWGTGREDERICLSVMRRLGLERFQLRSLDELSGGERQKVLIARALVQEPRVLLLDEPTSSLDPGNQHEIMEIVRDMARERGMTVLVVLHDLNLALHCSDRMFFMKNGHGICCCMPEDLSGDVINAVYGIDARIISLDGRRFVLTD